MKFSYSSRSMSTTAMVAALYTALCLAFAPISFGVIQFRIAEALTLLAIFSPNMVLAVTLGCAISNLLGFMLGVNPLLLDVFFGTFATAIAGYFSWKLGKFRTKGYPLLAAVPPIVINAIIIGGEITMLETGGIFNHLKLYFINAGYIGLSQIIPCLILGPILIIVLEKMGIAQKYMVEVG